MKVIHFVTSIDRTAGGVSTSVAALASEEGKHVEACIVTAPTQNPLSTRDVKVIQVPLGMGRYWSVVRSFRRILAQEKPDLVHIHGIWDPQTWWFQKQAQKLGIPVVVSPRGMLEPWILRRNRHKKIPALLLYQRKAILRADYIHATAESERDNIMFLGLNGLIHTIPNGVDVSTTEIRTDWGTNKKILYLSRIHVKKGIEILIRAVDALRDRLEGYQVIIAGQGEESYIQSLDEMIRELKLEGIVRLAGGLYGEEKWDAYKTADFFVLPTFSENFGNVIVESLESGTPVITTWGAPWEELILEKCGWWIDLSLENLIEAMKQALVITPFEREQMGRRGRHLVESKYTIGQVTLRMIEFYKTVIARKDGKKR